MIRTVTANWIVTCAPQVIGGQLVQMLTCPRCGAAVVARLGDPRPTVLHLAWHEKMESEKAPDPPVRRTGTPH